MKIVLAIAAAALIVTGVGSAAGGVGGAVFTHNAAVAENVYAHEDSSQAGKLVAGPLTMLAQSDVILEHTLTYTDGVRYADMDREDPLRDLWMTSTTVRTALNLGILAYGLSFFAIATGVALVAAGAGFGALAYREE
jgi:ABC-type Na+ efflux pump permease subunit